MPHCGGCLGQPPRLARPSSTSWSWACVACPNPSSSSSVPRDASARRIAPSCPALRAVPRPYRLYPRHWVRVSCLPLRSLFARCRVRNLTAPGLPWLPTRSLPRSPGLEQPCRTYARVTRPLRSLRHAGATIGPRACHNRPSSKPTFSPSQPSGAHTPRTGPYQLMDYTTVPISCASVDLASLPGTRRHC